MPRRTYTVAIPLISAGLVAVVVLGFYFVLKGLQTPPAAAAIEHRFATELAFLASLAGEMENGSPDPTSGTRATPDPSPPVDLPAIPSLEQPVSDFMRKLESAATEATFRESGVLEAVIVRYSPRATAVIRVFKGETVGDFWSPEEEMTTLHLDDILPRPSTPLVSFCYSGFRQAVKYERVVGGPAEKPVAIRIVFDPAALHDPELNP